MNRRKKGIRGIKRYHYKIAFIITLLLTVSVVGILMVVFLTHSNEEEVKVETIIEDLNVDYIPEEDITVQEDKNIKDTFCDIQTDSIAEAETTFVRYKKEAQEILNAMSLEEKVYQMFVVTPEQLTGVGTVTAAGNTTKECLEKYPVGGLIYFAPNIVSKEQTIEMLGEIQEYAFELEGIPLFLCVDEEGGRVARIANNPSFGIDKVKPMNEVKSVDEAYETGRKIGKYLSEIGFNVDFAPDADVLTNRNNTVIGNRSFGDNADVVTKYALAYSDGLHTYGVLSTFKHFPGHGATTDDTHKGIAYTDKSLEELNECELIPFKAAQDNEVDMVMISHISLPTVLGDNTPCTLSHYMITEILRQELGYDGIVITDAMNMGAITNNYNHNQAVKKAINAGVDMVLTPVDFKSAVNSVVAAVENGEIDIKTIDESVERIIIKKLSLIKTD